MTAELVYNAFLPKRRHCCLFSAAFRSSDDERDNTFTKTYTHQSFSSFSTLYSTFLPKKWSKLHSTTTLHNNKKRRRETWVSKILLFRTFGYFSTVPVRSYDAAGMVLTVQRFVSWWSGFGGEKCLHYHASGTRELFYVLLHTLFVQIEWTPRANVNSSNSDRFSGTFLWTAQRLCCFYDLLVFYRVPFSI